RCRTSALKLPFATRNFSRSIHSSLVNAWRNQPSLFFFAAISIRPRSFQSVGLKPSIFSISSTTHSSDLPSHLHVSPLRLLRSTQCHWRPSACQGIDCPLPTSRNSLSPSFLTAPSSG